MENLIHALIPARKGSKGIKNKNFLKIDSLSLVDRAINYCSNHPLIYSFTLSTDNESYTAPKNILNFNIDIRKKNLSADDSKIDEVVFDFIKKNNLKGAKYLALIEPTSPCRTNKDLFDVYDYFMKNNLDSCFTLSKVPSKYHYKKQFILNQQNKEGKVNNYGSINRQELETTGIRNGLVYLTKISSILKFKSLICGKIGFILTNRKVINIDHYQDLENYKNHLS
tara:strand:- start:136 stop:810 length:675 start_codon:yes stop_codon:yes gene_type:complete